MTISNSDREKLNDFKLMFKQLINLNNDQNIDEVIEALFFNIEKYYLEFGDSIKSIPVRFEPYKFHILQPVDGRYSLLDFLINRAFSNICEIEFHSSKIDPNEYSNDKSIRLNFEEFIKSFNDDEFDVNYGLKEAELLLMLHETGHALQALDTKDDNRIHEHVNKQILSLLQKVTFINRKLGHKYSNILKESSINRVETLNTIVATWMFKCPLKHPFCDNSNLCEGLNEMYATLFSGLYDDDKNFVLRDIDKDEGYYVMAPDFQIEYSKFTRFYYYLRCLCSKESLFMTTFLAGDVVLKEFASQYGSIIDYWWNHEACCDIRKIVEDTNESNKKHNIELLPVNTSEGKLKILLEYAAKYVVDNKNENKNLFVDAQSILDWIFFKAFEQRAMSNNYNYDEFLKQLRVAYNSQIVVLEIGRRGLRPSKPKQEYEKLIQKLLISKQEKIEVDGSSIETSRYRKK